MTIYQRMEEIFRVADVPGFLKEWRRTDEYPELPETYAVYNVTHERPVQCADDLPIFRRYDITVWVYGIQDVSAAAESISDALAMDGFYLPAAWDTYASIGGDHQDIRVMRAEYVDFGDYGQ